MNQAYAPTMACGFPLSLCRGGVTMSDHHVRPHRTAFTLAELLVVLAVLAIVVFVILPSLPWGTRRPANRSPCGANLNALVRAITIYSVSNRERVSGGRGWH